jgi:transposase InsO family protein
MPTDDRKDSRHEVGLFRYGVLGDLIHWTRGQRGLGDELEARSDKTYCIPGSRRTHVAEETMRGWLRAYRSGGFDALVPKLRQDNGQSRAIPQEVADLLCLIKEEQRCLSVDQVIQEARQRLEVPAEISLAPSTVHRLLSRAGLMQKLPADPTSLDHRRFTFEKAGELCMSDVMHGPAVAFAERRKRKTYLIAFLDDATRVVPYAAFAFAENVAAFLPVLEQAIRRRGIPKRLFVDNGAAYRSHHLSLVCAKLGVTLIHARPYQPAGKGKIERWFRTARMQLLRTLRPEDLRSLDALNRRLWGWVEGEYHHTPHKGLDGETPLERWAKTADEIRLPDAELAELFLFEEKRKVRKDRIVSLHGHLYEVDASLVGETVTLRFDPSRPGKTIEVWHKGRRVEHARLVDVHANCFVRRNHKPKDGQDPRSTPAAGLRLSDFGRDDGTSDKGDR